MIYGRYKKVRDAVWQLFVDFNIGTMPINVVEIASAAGIKVLKNSDVNVLHDGEAGASITDGTLWYIVYDDTNSKQRIRFTIAHELAHIFLGHELISGYHARTINKSKPEVETEADVFASRLLAPACVIWGLGLRSAIDIAKLCDISVQAAEIRASRMETLYARNKFLVSPLERKAFEQFAGFIEKYNG